jgi:hypothetical protein
MASAPRLANPATTSRSLRCMLPPFERRSVRGRGSEFGVHSSQFGVHSRARPRGRPRARNHDARFAVRRASQFTAQSSRLTIRGFAGCGLQLRSVKNYKPVNNATTVVSERVNFVWMLVALRYVILLFTRVSLHFPHCSAS